MKDDNAEIATMERQIADTAEHITRLQNELQEVDQVSPDYGWPFEKIRSFLFVFWITYFSTSSFVFICHLGWQKLIFLYDLNLKK